MNRLFSFLLIICPLFSFSQLSIVELDSKKVPKPATRDAVVDNWNFSQPGFQELSQQAKELFYWTNYCRNNPQKFWDSVALQVINTFPKELNKQEAKSLRLDLIRMGQLPMFKLNPILTKTAQAHATDIAGKKAQPNHNSTDGTDFGTRMKLAGIKYCANQNIALSSQGVLLSVILLYLDIGLPNLGHRKALLDTNLREIGVGAALYGVDQYFLVQDFACLQQ